MGICLIIARCSCLSHIGLQLKPGHVLGSGSQDTLDSAKHLYCMMAGRQCLFPHPSKKCATKRPSSFSEPTI
uniref:Uncharacterized protein n=1 Tax=Anguilla anguilla TaxID=7936 RepID=A0A0E9SJK6_ANGAN